MFCELSRGWLLSGRGGHWGWGDSRLPYTSASGSSQTDLSSALGIPFEEWMKDSGIDDLIWIEKALELTKFLLLQLQTGDQWCWEDSVR